MGVDRATTWLASKEFFFNVINSCDLSNAQDTTLVLDAKNFAISVQHGYLHSLHKPLSGVLLASIAKRLQEVLKALVKAGYSVIAVLDGPHDPIQARVASHTAKARANQETLNPFNLQRSPCFDVVVNKTYHETAGVSVVEANAEADAVVVREALAVSERKYVCIVTNDSDLWFFPEAAQSNKLYFVQTGDRKPHPKETDDEIIGSHYRFAMFDDKKEYGRLYGVAIPSTRITEFLKLSPERLPSLAVNLGNDRVTKTQLVPLHEKLVQTMRFDEFQSGTKPCFNDGKCTTADCKRKHTQQRKPCLPFKSIREKYSSIDRNRSEGRHEALPRDWAFKIADAVLGCLRSKEWEDLVIDDHRCGAYRPTYEAVVTPPTEIDPPVLDLLDLDPNPWTIQIQPVDDEPFYRTVLRTLHQQELLEIKDVECILGSMTVPVPESALVVQRAPLTAWTYWLCALNERATNTTCHARRFFALASMDHEEDEEVEWKSNPKFIQEYDAFLRSIDPAAGIKERLNQMNFENWDDE